MSTIKSHPPLQNEWTAKLEAVARRINPDAKKCLARLVYSPPYVDEEGFEWPASDDYEVRVLDKNNAMRVWTFDGEFELDDALIEMVLGDRSCRRRSCAACPRAAWPCLAPSLSRRSLARRSPSTDLRLSVLGSERVVGSSCAKSATTRRYCRDSHTRGRRAGRDSACRPRAQH